MKKLVKFAEYILFLLFLVLFIFFKQKLSILLTIPVLFFLYYFYKKEKIKNYELFLFCTAFIVRLISIILLKVEITDDFKTMYEASLSVLKSNFDFMNGFYFQTYPFQLGLTLYQALILKIIPIVFLLKLLNSIYTSFIVLYLYKISKIFVKEKTARIISFSYLFYFYPIYLNSVLTNQHIPALLMLISIYFLFIKKDSLKYACIIGLLLGFANFFRTESIIMIMAISIYQLIYITHKNYKNVFRYLIVFLFTYFAFTTFTTKMISISPIYQSINTEEKQDKNVTLWKFYCGLSDKYNGLYNEEDVEAYFNTNEEKELLMTRVKKDYKKFPVLFLKKEVILWTQTNYDLRILNPLQGFWNKLVLNFNQGYLNLIIILLVISLIPKKEEDNKEVIFIKLFIGLYYGIYLFIEISPRYAYNLHMLVFLLLGIGLEKIICKCNQLYTKNNRKLVERNQ